MTEEKEKEIMGNDLLDSFARIGEADEDKLKPRISSIKEEIESIDKPPKKKRISTSRSEYAVSKAKGKKIRRAVEIISPMLANLSIIPIVIVGKVAKIEGSVLVEVMTEHMTNFQQNINVNSETSDEDFLSSPLTKVVNMYYTGEEVHPVAELALAMFGPSIFILLEKALSKKQGMFSKLRFLRWRTRK